MQAAPESSADVKSIEVKRSFTPLDPEFTNYHHSSNYHHSANYQSTGITSNAITPSAVFVQIREMMREPLAEFAGVAILVLFGVGVNCQVALSTNTGVASSPHGTFLSVNFGWAAGVAMAVWVCGGISAGHINPAFTLAMATWRGFPWRKVPGYIFAQVLGGLFGSAIVYGNYIHAIDIFEGGHNIRTQATASLFVTYSLDYLTGISCFFDEFIGTAILCLMIVALTDKHNMAPSVGMLPVALFVLLIGLGTAFGMQTSYALNPARDFGPRVMLTFAGYGSQLYNYRNQYWFWCTTIAPFLGAQVGVGIYDLFLKKQEPVECPTSPTTSELCDKERKAERRRRPIERIELGVID